MRFFRYLIVIITLFNESFHSVEFKFRQETNELIKKLLTVTLCQGQPQDVIYANEYGIVYNYK